MARCFLTSWIDRIFPGPNVSNCEMGIEGALIMWKRPKACRWLRTEPLPANGEKETEEILAIIEGHNSRHEPLSLNDVLVKGAGKLFRYTQARADIDYARFGRTMEIHIDDFGIKNVHLVSNAGGQGYDSRSANCPEDFTEIRDSKK